MSFTAPKQSQPSPLPGVIRSSRFYPPATFAGTDRDSTMMLSWSDLPAGLVAAIADELTELADLVRFRSVCPSWRSATAAHAARLRVPLLLLPTESSTRVRPAWSVADDRLREIPVPAAVGHSFLFASYHGWILAVARDLTATLVYPFTGDSAGLPALPFSSSGDDNEVTIRDLVWDWSPYGVLVSSVKDKGAFFCRPGDESWRPVGCSSDGFTSVTYCQGSFYLFDGRTCTGTVVDVETMAVVAEIIKPPALEMPTRYWNFEANLVVSPDELLVLVRTDLLHTGYKGWPRLFKAFRAERAAGGGRSPGSWLEVAGTGNQAVFVDHFRAFCVEANGVNGVRRNCMYVASSHEEVNDDYGMDINGRYTVEMLDLADLTRKSLWYGNLLKVRCNRFWQWPSWSLPKLH